MRCQKTYLADGYCKNQVFGASKWCRWHKVIEEFRADLSRYPKLAAQGMMYGSSAFLYGAGYSLWLFTLKHDVIWAILALYLFGSSAKFFADGCIAQDHPFSQFAFWGKLLAFGLVVEIIVGCVLGYYLSTHYLVATEVVRQVSLPSILSRYGPVLLTLAIILNSGVSVHLFVNRVMFLRQPWLKSTIAIMIWGMAGTAVRPLWIPQAVPSVVQQSRPVSSSATPESAPKDSERNATDHFWQPVLGDRYWPPLIAVYVLGFVLAEIINKRMRSGDQAMAVFRATVWPSFPICYGGPFLGAVGARYVLLWTKTQGPWLFIPVALSINVAAVAVGTRFLVRTYLSNLRAGARTSRRGGDRRQELVLFLRVGSWRFEHTAGEIAVALDYSELGQVEAYGEQQGFLVVKMAGSSADGMFSALRDLLLGLEMGAGSFAVLRYGDRGEERVIEL